jgi:hypothetical protein
VMLIATASSFLPATYWPEASSGMPCAITPN